MLTKRRATFQLAGRFSLHAAGGERGDDAGFGDGLRSLWHLRLDRSQWSRLKNFPFWMR
jgi:hypothetical protein